MNEETSSPTAPVMERGEEDASKSEPHRLWNVEKKNACKIVITSALLYRNYSAIPTFKVLPRFIYSIIIFRRIISFIN